MFPNVCTMMNKKNETNKIHVPAQYIDSDRKERERKKETRKLMKTMNTSHSCSVTISYALD